MAILEQGEGIQVDDSRRNSHERRVEAVEHATMSWQYIATILDAESTLEEALYQVAKGAKNHNYKT